MLIVYMYDFVWFWLTMTYTYDSDLMKVHYYLLLQYK